MTKWDAEQTRNARIIADVGYKLGASDRDVLIAVMTAMQESGLRNIDYGDQAGPDSRGLFQQRKWWGTLAERMDPATAAYLFFTGGKNQQGLLDKTNRDQMSLTRAAQSVQISAYPDAYAKHETAARALLAGFGGGGDTTTAAAPTANPRVLEGAAGRADRAMVREPMARQASSAPTGMPVAPGTQAAAAPGLAATTAPGSGATVGPLDNAILGTVQAPDPIYADNPLPQLSPEQFRSLFPDAPKARSFTVPGGTGAVRVDLLGLAKSYVGTPYAWGGNGRDGIDCSGLVQAVYGQFGIDVPRLSADQLRAGQATAYRDLRPGDLIGWQHGERNGSGVEHIAIYAGDDTIIEAPRPGLAVRARKLSASEIATAEGAHFGQLD